MKLPGLTRFRDVSVNGCHLGPYAMGVPTLVDYYYYQIYHISRFYYLCLKKNSVLMKVAEVELI